MHSLNNSIYLLKSSMNQTYGKNKTPYLEAEKHVENVITSKKFVRLYE